MNRWFTNSTLRSVAIAGLSVTFAFAAIWPARASAPDRHVLIRDITSIEGVRDNMLVGYGIVAGLDRTGDSQQTYFTVQTLAKQMQNMRMHISQSQDEIKHEAS